VLSSNVKEIRKSSVLLDVKGELRELANDFVWVFVGGTPPYDFLRKIGVQFGARDLTLEANNEAKEAAAFKNQASMGLRAEAAFNRG
jgi:thioredoxin reductase